MQKQQMIETQMQVKSQQVIELEDQASHLTRMEPEKEKEIIAKKKEVSEKFEKILAPLEQRKKELLMKKEIFQFLRDIEDENIWIEEKMNLVTSEDYGNRYSIICYMRSMQVHSTFGPSLKRSHFLIKIPWLEAG